MTNILTSAKRINGHRVLSVEKIVLQVLLLSFFTSSAWSQSLSHPLGNFKTMKKISGGISIQTDFGNMKALVYSANVIKIDVTQHPSFDDFSYAVVATPDASTKFSLTEEKEKITLTTDSLKLVIMKKPVRISIYDLKGRLINGDDAAFGTSWIGDEITTYKKLFPHEKFIGLGEKVGDLDRRGNGYQNWNSDVPGYEGRQDPLYCTIPFYIGIHDSVVYGIFLDNSSKTQFNFGASQERFSSFAVEDGDMNYYVICHSTVAKIIESYSWLTGRMPMPRCGHSVIISAATVIFRKLK